MGHWRGFFMQIIRTINQQQELFCSWISTPLKSIAKHCANEWSQNTLTDEQLANALLDSIKQIPQYALCYLISPKGIIQTPTISHTGCDPTDIGKDVSLRPYFVEWDENQDFFLSRLYTSTKTNLPCMTALQAVRIEGKVFAIIAIDFDGGGNASKRNAFHAENHTQIKGDPSIRQQLFAQTRTITPMEEQIDFVHQNAEWLLLNHGAFFVQLRYSRSTATVRFIDSPYHDSMFTLEQLTSSNSPNRQPLSSMSTVLPEQIIPAFELFKTLRLADENIYLRSASLNIITGMVELNFSCDGTHNLPINEFLEKSTAYWLTASDNTPRTNTVRDAARDGSGEKSATVFSYSTQEIASASERA
jgi:hypothetical protein